MNASHLRTSMLAAALVVAGAGCAAVASAGCATLETKEVELDPAVASPHTTVPRVLATIEPVIEIGIDDTHRAAYVVLAADADDAETEGVAEYWDDPIDTGVLVARKSAAKEALAPFANVEHARIVLHGDGGARCEGVLGAPFVLGRVSGEYYDPDGTQPPPSSAHQIDDEAGTRWESTSGGRAIVASVEGCVQRKDEPQWVTASTSNVGKFEATTADERTRADLLARFRSLRAWSDIAESRRQWETTMAAPGAVHVLSWDELDGASPSVDIFDVDGVRTAWVSIAVGGGCGDFYGQLAARYVEDKEGWTLGSASTELDASPSIAWKTPLGIAWSFADGRVLRGRDGIGEGGADGGSKLVAPRIAFHGCPC